MTTLLIVLNLLQAAPALMQTNTFPFRDVPAAELQHQLELYADNEDALVAFQLEARRAMQLELAVRQYGRD